MVIVELPAGDPAADHTRNNKFDAEIYGQYGRYRYSARHFT
jgi:hypothetical protein